MSLENFIKKVQNIMRKDKGVGTNDVLILEQLVWLLFLFVYDFKEEVWELHDDDYESIIPEKFRWRNWAIDKKDGKALTGDELLNFVDRELLPTLKNLTIDETTQRRKAIVRSVFEDANNYMKNGILLRKLINIINQMDFTEISERHAFNNIYEDMLKGLQSAGNSGQYFTPRPLTKFVTEMTKPRLGDKIADLACGTAGFLVSALEILKKQAKTVEDIEIINQSLYGVEKYHLPHLLGVTNLLLHDIDVPLIDHKNSFSDNIREFSEEDKFDVFIMNPPFGSKSEEPGILLNFPKEFQTSETADLFMALILHRIKVDGRVGIILPDGFMFGDDSAKINIKKKLLDEFNLHTIVRVPEGAFAPYTSIATNILFFDYNQSGTQKTWYYEVPLPEGYRTFSKTRPILDRHFDSVREWWDNREESEYAWTVTKEKIVQRNYNLDIKNPNNITTEEKYSLNELLEVIQHKSNNINSLIEDLKDALQGVEE